MGTWHQNMILKLEIIKQINYLNNDLLSIGSTLLIPLSKTKSNTFIPYEMHIVSEGDKLWDIAKKYNLEVSDLANMNSINENSHTCNLDSNLQSVIKIFIEILNQRKELFYDIH